jgi:hypothetical protein
MDQGWMSKDHVTQAYINDIDPLLYRSRKGKYDEEYREVFSIHVLNVRMMYKFKKSRVHKEHMFFWKISKIHTHIGHMAKNR